jgi:hypothetical protein
MRTTVFLAVALTGVALFLQFGRDGLTPTDHPSGTDELVAVGGDVIARVDGESILRDEWQSRVGDVTPEQSRRLLQSEVRRKAVLSAAEKAGYGDREEVRQRVEEAMLALYLREAVDAKLRSVTLSDAELEAYLADHPLSPPRPLRRAAVLRRQWAEELTDKSAEDQQEALAAIEAELRSARVATLAANHPIAHFGALAARVSDHRSSSSRGGVVGYFQPERLPNDELPAEVHAALWALEAPGDISEPIETEDALYLVRFVDEHIRPGQDPERQRALIAEQLLAEKRRDRRQELLARLEAEAGVAIAPDWQARPTEPPKPQPPASPIPAQAAAQTGRVGGS